MSSGCYEVLSSVFQRVTDREFRRLKIETLNLAGRYFDEISRRNFVQATSRELAKLLVINCGDEMAVQVATTVLDYINRKDLCQFLLHSLFTGWDCPDSTRRKSLDTNKAQPVFEGATALATGWDCPDSTRRKSLDTNKAQPLFEGATALATGQGTLKCTKCRVTLDMVKWTLVEPFTCIKNGNCTFRIAIPGAGQYECSRTCVRWKAQGPVTVEYRYSSWSRYSQDLEKKNYMIAGPLMDITVISGAVEEIHLPHFICLGSEDILVSNFKVLHVKDESLISVNAVCGANSTHAWLQKPSFSLKGILYLIRSYLCTSIHMQVLLFRVFSAANFTLHVYLVPNHQPFIDAVEMQEKRQGSIRIYKPAETEKSLHIRKSYSLKTLPKVTVIPQKIKLRYISSGQIPPFFEVYSQKVNPTLSLFLLSDEEELWKTEIRPGDCQRLSFEKSEPEGACFLQQHEYSVTERLSMIQPILRQLLQKGVINEEEQEMILQKGTRIEQNTTLVSLVKRKGSQAVQELYRVLQDCDPYLIEDLERS
ncbi:caspase recruitment domain-containing protein 8-like isoform X1 [Acipenser oxyrinchus oxyrinchus]|uniref:Caspase recruitment domain-containing protein 8-like isoform X1 n=1 Tax=Acipenser oxyrinchus oxyrinchus TaxID=40147 RepID=A0AAD8CKI7_ACIOX|nr:caspase recruitment domain-containing protein 8-like isoform X1 [Acipenser oxyrinchus oxyrinchus]